MCRCANDGACDHVAGTCSCTPGWRGPQCDRPCPAGFYGAECQQHCFCENGARCDHVTGECRCAAGWMGKGCRQACRPGTWGMGCNQVPIFVSYVIYVLHV